MDESVDANKVPLAARRRVVNGVSVVAVIDGRCRVWDALALVETTLRAPDTGPFTPPSGCRHSGHGMVGHSVSFQAESREQQLAV